jgi:hypothetical protein
MNTIGLTNEDIKRRWFKKKGKNFLIPADARLVERVSQLKKDVREFCGVKLTATYIFREGANLFIRKLRVEMTKAKNGKLNAKRRKALIV